MYFYMYNKHKQKKILILWVEQENTGSALLATELFVKFNHLYTWFN